MNRDKEILKEAQKAVTECCVYDEDDNVLDYRNWFFVGAKWADEDVLKTVNDYVEDMRKYERKGYYEHGFMRGVEKFAEYMTEKLTK